MSLLDADDRQAMVEAVGEVATTDAGTMYVAFAEPGQVIDLQEAQVLVTEPTALGVNVDIDAQGLTGDPNPSNISILGKAYKIKEIVPDGDGFSVMGLRDA